jgi:hypothetical protein
MPVSHHCYFYTLGSTHQHSLIFALQTLQKHNDRTLPEHLVLADPSLDDFGENDDGLAEKGGVGGEVEKAEDVREEDLVDEGAAVVRLAGF